MTDEARGIQEEFDRAAASFALRTKGRFDYLDAVAFSRVEPGQTVLEVGTGTGHFLSLFEEAAGLLVGIDVSAGMLEQARDHHPGLRLVRGNATRLPIASRSIDLVVSAQMLHHIAEPVPVLKEMRRVSGPDGHVFVVDQVAVENLEAIGAMNKLERLRDPSHAMSRPPSALWIAFGAAGLELVAEEVVEHRQRFSDWMWPDEFPEYRIAEVRRFIAERGHETGMEFEADGRDYLFTRRRIMALARRV